MESSEARKALMVGLIYPAVLGSVLYSAIQVVVDPVMGTFVKAEVWRFDSTVAFKLLILAVVIVFFTCDYLYIVFTNHLRAWFFAADCLFIVLMYSVWWAIDIKNGPATQPRVGIVLCALFLFMVMYFIWDFAEYRIARGDERTHFARVLRWEIVSLILLAVLTAALGLGYYSAIVFIVIVGTVTSWFAVLAWGKRRYAKTA